MKYLLHTSEENLAVLTINDNPSISNTIVFDLNTTLSSGCLSDPYKVNSVVIYFVSRDFASGNTQSYEKEIYDTNKLRAAEEAEALACNDPTEDNILKAKKSRDEAEDSKSLNSFFFKEAVPIKIIGTEGYPAWLSTDLDENSQLKIQPLDKVETGKFQYTWEPEGAREGDYFICWTWTPNIAGDSFSSHQKFSLMGDTQTTTSIPTHFTDPKKYITLLDRYTPEMFKNIITDGDRTPDVIDKFNKSVAMGFDVLENLTNQIVDLQDANSLHEFLIPYLSNLFGLKLSTDDPTRWRGQIKRAIPLYKSKGTKRALYEALEHNGTTLHSVKQLWQVISSYTWQESFIYDGTNNIFVLEKNIQGIDAENFEIYWRANSGDLWTEYDSDYVTFGYEDGKTIMTWIGDQIVGEEQKILESGDEVRVLYLYTDIPSSAQTIESYIRTLPLMDTRDGQQLSEFPPKNWNVRLISEDDPMFSMVIPDRNPFHDPLIYGKIRTEFPYSENIYNMEEYNGSIRDSRNPCDIDKRFIDPCTACISSNYNLDLEAEEICDDKILEIKEIIKNNTPFHAVLYNCNFTGGLNEFIEPPVENLEILATYSGGDFVLSGTADPYFHRIMLNVETQGIKRNELANKDVVFSGSGVAYNEKIVMFCPSTVLVDAGLSSDGSCYVDVKSPSPISGQYNIVGAKANTVEIDGAAEPLDSCDSVFDSSELNSCAFTFDINGEINLINGTNCNIEQDNLYKLNDENINFYDLGVKSQKESASWKILIEEYSITPYLIKDILPSGELVLENNGSLPLLNVSDVIYSILNDQDEEMISSETGMLTLGKRGLVTVLSLEISGLFLNKEYYQEVSGNEYLVGANIIGEGGDPDQYYIEGYDLGDMNGVEIKIIEKIIKSKVGYLSYNGLKLKIDGNLEFDLNIQNGASQLGGDLSNSSNFWLDNNNFKENFIVLVDEMAYWISEIEYNSGDNCTIITLSGPSTYWKTLTFGGTSVDIEIYQYEKLGRTIIGQNFDLPEHEFQTIDRNGREVIYGIDTNQDTVISLSEPVKPEGFNDSIGQKEEISLKIERKTKEKKDE